MSDPFRCICDPDDIFDPPDPRPRAVEGCPAHRARRVAQQFELHAPVKVDAPEQCRARTGVIWKLGGEVCSCVRQLGHSETDHPAGTWHACSCNAWFDDSCVRWRPAA